MTFSNAGPTSTRTAANPFLRSDVAALEREGKHISHMRYLNHILSKHDGEIGILDDCWKDIVDPTVTDVGPDQVRATGGQDICYNAAFWHYQFGVNQSQRWALHKDHEDSDSRDKPCE